MSTPAVKRIEVVAAVVVQGDQILCVQRGANAREYISQKWEFPGGKVEPGETPAQALAREIQEELHLAIEVSDLLITVEHTYPHFHITMHAYECRMLEERAEVTLTEHIAYRWLAADSAEFAALDWAAADVPIVDLLVSRALSGKI